MNSIKSDITHVENLRHAAKSAHHDDESILFKKAAIKRRNEAPREALRVSLSAKHPEKPTGNESSNDGTSNSDHDFRSDMNLYQGMRVGHAKIDDSNTQSSKSVLSGSTTKSQPINRNVVRKTLKFHTISRFRFFCSVLLTYNDIESKIFFEDKRRNTVSIIGFNKLNEKSASNRELHRTGAVSNDRKVSKFDVDGLKQIGELI
jgi:hypothetical protein